MAANTIAPPDARVAQNPARPPAEPALQGRGARPGAGRVPPRVYYTGAALAAAAVAMLFTGLTSALVVRKGVSNDWLPLAIPRLAWFNAVLLLAGSAACERWRRSAAGGRMRSIPDGLPAAWITACGLAFLGGQATVWRQLAARPASPAMDPALAFFFLLTGAHAVVAAGALLGVLYAALKARRQREPSAARAMAGAAALFWHFAAGLWVYLLILAAIEM